MAKSPRPRHKTVCRTARRLMRRCPRCKRRTRRKAT